MEYWLQNKNTKNNGTGIWLKFITIDPEKEDLDIFRTINEILATSNNRIKNLINKISMRFLCKIIIK